MINSVISHPPLHHSNRNLYDFYTWEMLETSGNMGGVRASTAFLLAYFLRTLINIMLM